MTVQKMKIPKKHLYFAEDTNLELKSGEDGSKEYFSMTAYSGKIIKGHWLGDLAIDVSGIKFTGKRFPILEQHDLEKKIGVSNSKPVTSNNQVVFEKINLLKNKTAQEFASNLDDGFPYQASLGIRPKKIEELGEDTTAEVNGYKMKGPGIIIRECTFREASACVFGADPNTNVDAFSDEEEEFEIELVSTGNKKEDLEEKSMTLKELKEKYPELFAEIQNKEGEKDTKIQELSDQVQNLTKERDDLKKETENLSETAQKYEKRIVNLEKVEQLRKEKEMKDEAKSIVVAKLTEHSIPVRLHDKIQRNFNHNEFIGEDGVFDKTKFSEAVDAEIKDWASAVSEIVKPAPVQGFGSAERETVDLSDEIDKDVDRLFGYVNKKQKTE